MKDFVSVIFDDKMIVVDGIGLQCEFDKPENLHAMLWREGRVDKQIRIGREMRNEYTENYDVIRPYVDIWQSRMDEIEAEKRAAEEYEASFENQLKLKLNALKSAFEQASVNTHCMSSLGFEINAGSVAKRDIDGLIEKMEYSGQETEMFRGYDNDFHQVTLDQLKLMRIEVINNGNALYQRKWQLEAQINACTTVEELNAINIDFEV